MKKAIIFMLIAIVTASVYARVSGPMRIRRVYVFLPSAAIPTVLEWLFTSVTNGLTLDTSGNGNHGDINESTSNEPVFTNGFLFDGVDDFIVATNFIGISNLTTYAIEITARVDLNEGTGDELTFFGKVGESGNPTLSDMRMDFGDERDRIRIIHRVDTIAQYDATTPNNSLDFAVGQMVHIVYNQTGVTPEIFINGASQLLTFAVSTDITSGIDDLFNATTKPDNFSVGIFNGVSLAIPFDGLIGSVIILPEPLTQLQVTNRFLALGL